MTLFELLDKLEKLSRYEIESKRTVLQTINDILAQYHQLTEPDELGKAWLLFVNQVLQEWQTCAKR
jgi:hypothetical protein